MERPLPDTDSDDDDTFRRLGSLVLRPAITSLPSIGDDNDTDGGESSSETEVVFSSINWAAQESAGLLFDQEPSSPGTVRPQTYANTPTGAGPLSRPNGSKQGASSLRSPVRAQPTQETPPTRGSSTASSTTMNPAPASPAGTPRRAGPPTPSATTPRGEALVGDDGALHLGENDPHEPYEGRGWLSGAAGRLANIAERRRANAAATDAEQVADAARYAAALQQHREQQPIAHGALATSSSAGVVAATGATSRVAVPGTAPPQQQEQPQELGLSLDHVEVERRILRDFEEAIQAADSEPPLLASSGLSLESTVAGLELDDLDALIARLTAGTTEIQHPTSSVSAAAAAAAVVLNGGRGAASGPRPWALEPLPAADSLWSDEEDEAVAAADAGPAAGRAKAGRGVAEPCGTPLGAAGEHGPAAVAPPAAAPTPAAGPQAAGQSNGPPHQPGGSLPAKFKFFAGPVGPAAAAPVLPPAPLKRPAAAGGDGGGGGGPVVQDLRQAITDTVQRNSQEAAAAAAQRQSDAKAAAARRQSEAKVAAARRRLVADSDDSEAGASDDGDEGGSGQASGMTGAGRRVRPVPPKPSVPGPAPPPGQPPAAARPPAPAPDGGGTPAAAQTSQTPAASATPTTLKPPAGAAATTATAKPPKPPAAPAAAVAASEPTARGPRTVSWSQSVSEAVSTASNGEGGGATAAVVTPRSASVGTDAADLRPASRSVFVCTTERKAEEEERARDIREYLKARAVAAVAKEGAAVAAAASAATAAAAAVERRWPEPPAALTERIAALAERQAAAAAAAVAGAAAAALPKPARPQRGVVATFAGGDEGGGGSANGGTSGGAAAGEVSRMDGHVGAGVAAPPAAVPRAFATCSTEGDEEFLSEPPPTSITDARTERGARMAAAGTVIPTSRATPPGSSGDANSAAAAAAAVAPGPAASTGRVRAGSVAAAAATPRERPGAGSTTSAAAPGSSSVAVAASMRTITTRATAAAAARPAALQLSPYPTASDGAPPSAAVVSPVGPAPSAAGPAVQAAKPPAAAAAAAPADLCRLPAWLPPSSCFTLLLTSPANLPSREVGALLEWLLLRAAAPTSESSSRQDHLPAFSVVGVRLLAAPPSWPLLPPLAAVGMALAEATPPLTHAGSLSSRAGGGGGGGVARVLAVACLPRAGVDSDVYSHELRSTAAADAEAAAAAALRLAAALAALPWRAVLAPPDADDERAPSGDLSTGDDAMPRGTLGGWVSTRSGAELLFSPLRLPPHAFSQQALRASSCGSAAAAASPSGGGAAAADAPGSSTFVSAVTAGALRDPHLLRRLLQRAARVGLTLRGLQVVYATEEAAAAVVASTPHRPLPYTAAAVLALSGRHEPTRRWQAQLGPPEARLAGCTDPYSLHAMYGDAARHITCSYDGASAARELAALFSAGGDGQPPSLSPLPSPRLQQQQLLLLQSASQRASAVDGSEAAAGVSGLAGESGPPTAQWLALPACGAAQQAWALSCLQHMLWCGHSLRGLLLMRLPGEGPPAQRLRAGASQGPALVAEVSGEEAADQLPLMLAAMTPPPPPAAQAVAVAAAAARSLLPPDALRARLAPADVQSLPQPYVAEQLLVAAAGDAALNAVDDGGAAASFTGAAAAAPSPQAHHGEDAIAVVALQGRPLQAAALLLAALTAHATARGSPSPERLELVACRYLRQVPSDVANCLVALHPQHTHGAGTGAGGAPGGAPARAANRLVISQPALLAVLHGPSAQTLVARWLTAALQRLHGAPEQATAAAAGGTSAGDDAAWAAMLELLLREYAPAAAAPPPVAAVSVSQAAAKRALSYAFGPAHVFLDAGLHDGLHRPPLSPSAPAAAAAADYYAAASSTPLFRLLAGPQRLPAVVALDFGALHRNLLPRLLKQLWREGYALHAATTCRLRPGGGAAAAMPALIGQPAVLLHVSRSNGVQHLRALAAALAAASGGPRAGGGAAAATTTGVHTCGTWRDAVAVLREVWPPPPACAAEPWKSGDVRAAAAAAAGAAPGADAAAAGFLALGGAAGARPARRFVRPEGARLLQLTAMVVTPPGPHSAAAEAVAPLDWPRLADALEALHAEGFRLAAVRAAAATPRDLADLGRASCRVSPAQQQAVHAAAAAAAAMAVAAAAASGGGEADLLPPPPPPCNLVMLALARDSAVTSLQVLLDEAARAATAAAVAEARPGHGPCAGGPAGGALVPSLAGRGPGRREAVAALAALVPCISVAHSPAAAEQQVAAVFEEVYGAGGVALLQ